MKTAVVYARYSSERQSEQSIEGQLRVCYDFAEKNELQIVDTYIDRATTGTNDNRAAFQKMLSDSDTHPDWDIVLVYAIDRFGRNGIDIAVNKQKLLKNGKILISATQRTSMNIDGTKNLDGILNENFMIGLAEYYSVELSQKIRRGQNESRIKGNFLGGKMTFGYYVEKKKLYVDKDKAEIVNFIFEEFAKGMKIIDIIKVLTEKGIFHNGKPFKDGVIYRMLRCEKYIGIYRHKDEIYDNIYPQIVSVELFQLVQGLLKNGKGRCGAKVEYLLRGKIICGKCGNHVNGESGTAKNGATNHYYKCMTRKEKHRSSATCDLRIVRKAEIEKLVIDTTIQLLSDDETLSKMADEMIKICKEEAESKSVINVLIEEKKRIQKSIDNLLKAIEDGIYTASTKNRLSQLETELVHLSGKIRIEENKKSNIPSKEQIIKYIKDGLSKGEKALIRILIDKVILHDDTIEIVYKYGENKNPNKSDKQACWDFYLSGDVELKSTATNFSIKMKYLKK